MKEIKHTLKVSEWKDGKLYTEEHIFDTFIESSWYYIKYISGNKTINSDIINKWLPVDQYIGGIEHAALHLIYSRFFHKIMILLQILLYDLHHNY